MRDRLGVLVMEDEENGVSVQLFEDTEKARTSFRNLKGRPGDPPTRATLITVDHTGQTVKGDSVMLPVLPDTSEDAPDAWVLGVGPIVTPPMEKQSKE